MTAGAKIVFHGNFESEKDWSFLGPDWNVFPLWEFLREFPHLANWNDFVQALRNKIGENKIEHIVGYSLGGRILLNLVESGLRADRVTFISTHTGLTTESERTERVWSDLKWKEHVLKSDWRQVDEEWNSQEVFSQDPQASENFFDLKVYRREIAQAFDLLSLGRMKSYRDPDIAEKEKLRIQFAKCARATWVCGGRDLKFMALGKAFAADYPLEFINFPECSHRVHRSDPFGLFKFLK